MFYRILLSSCLAISLAAPGYAALPPGHPVADVIVPTPDGKKINLRQYRGKTLVIAMISLNCEHCVKTLETMIQLQKELGPQGVQALAVSGDPNPVSVIEAFITHYYPNFPIGYLDHAPFLKLAGLKPDARPFVPIVMFVDARGMVRAEYVGDDAPMKEPEKALRGVLNELLKETHAAPRAEGPAN